MNGMVRRASAEARTEMRIGASAKVRADIGAGRGGGVRATCRALASALRADLNYLFGDGVMQYPIMFLMPFAFLLVFQDRAFIEDFGYTLAVSMEVFSCTALIVSMAVVDVQSGYRLRALMPVVRRTQVLARYVMGVALAVLASVMIVLLDLLQSYVISDWSFMANMPTAGWGLLIVLLVVAVYVPLSYLWNSANGLQVSLLVLYLVFVVGIMAWSEISGGVTSGMLRAFGSAFPHMALFAVVAVAVTIAVYVASYLISVRIYQRKEW